MSDPPPKPQADKFRDLARELECDEDEERFEETVRGVAKSPPHHQQQSAEKKKP